MTGKEILFDALRNRPTPRPAWTPFVGVHGGKMLGVSATEYLQSADLIVEGQRHACERYRADGIPIVFDLQLEAEVLGCDLHWADEVPPSVVSHPLATGNLAALPAFDVSKGRFPLVAEATRRLREAVGHETALYGLITGPLTLLAHLRGSDLFMDLMLDPDFVKSAMEYCAEVGRKTSDFFLEHGAEVIAVVDPMTSQISPAHFEEFVAPYVNDIFTHIRRRKAYSSLFVCGDATRNLEPMCRTTCDHVSIDENIPLELLRSFAEKHGKAFGGNLKLTTVLLLGKEADAMLDTLRCVDEGGSKGFVLAPGCDLPYGTPEANLEAVARMVHDEYQRTVARTTVHATDLGSFDDLVLPDYDKDPRVILDVITLDSAACAPCLYMVDAAIKGAAAAGVPTDVREHKIKSRDGIGYMCRLGVKNLPTLCIDGKAVYISQIPDTQTLAKAIAEQHRAKTASSS